ncbi:hypothetical protein ACFE6N_20535 [Pedobacter sp. BG31]|uniref:hypothetical protein n=1 Tax=Pedobacter sp. BG31 TaxID=3349697 RepID=UPI0035F26DF4
MKTAKTLTIILILMVFGYHSFAQKGVKMLQPSGSLAIPTGKLSDEVNLGYGVALKGIWGVGKADQQITLEAGYNRFNVKNLPTSIEANYATVPVYLGYRAKMGAIIIEGQSGVAFNHVKGTGPSGKASGNQTAFGWALSVGYAFRDLELDVRYQNSESGTDTYVIRFVGIRAAYNFSL